jgi:hypothetical protein
MKFRLKLLALLSFRCSHSRSINHGLKTERVLGAGVFHCPRFSLQFKRWSRLAHASSSELPFLLDVELRGIPAHAWSRSTAERILGESCWVADVLPSTMAKQDLSSYKLKAWSFAPDRLPQAMELSLLNRHAPPLTTRR